MDIVIRKSDVDLHVAPNFTDYAGERGRFSWAQIERELTEQPESRFNMAYMAVDRHANGPLADKTAFRFLARHRPDYCVSWADLARSSNRFARALRRLGLGKDARLFTLLNRCPALYTGILGSLKNGTVVAPLFSAFSTEAISTRIGLGEGQVLLTSESLYRQKIAKARARMPSLTHIILVSDDAGRTTQEPDTWDFWELMEAESDERYLEHTCADDMALLHFTSGTTGTPKGAVHVHGAALGHYSTGRYALDLHPDDIYWCTADPGWVTGTSYGLLTPLMHGVTSIIDQEEFDAQRWYQILAEQKVSVWYTAPTAIRQLMKAGAELARTQNYPQLRLVASVGEPLNPEAVWWGQDTLGLPIHDNWWQTETGSIQIGNTPAFDIKPGSMGRPMPGVEAAIVERGSNGKIQVINTPYKSGELAIKCPWPSMFRGYLNNDKGYRKCFAGDWYLSGDLAMKDEDGYFWFVGRAEDVLHPAGDSIGAFEVESVIMELPAVAEVGAIGKPDPAVHEIIKVFVSLKHGFEGSDNLRAQILRHVRQRLGAAVAPKEIEFVANLPRTRSGKIMRRLLRARELGKNLGDISTLEDPKT